MEMNRKTNDIIYIRLFQICIIVSSVFGEEATYYRLANFTVLIFFLSVLVMIANKGWKLIIGDGLKLSFIYLFYTLLSLLWTQNISVAENQLSTQLQLYLLIFFTYQLFIYIKKVDYYFDALYIAGYGMILYALFRYGGLNNYMAIMSSGVRLGSGIANENAFGLVFSNAALISMYYVLLKKKKIHFISIPIFTFFALSSGSRKAAALILAGAIGILILKYGIKKAYKYILAFPILGIIVYYVLQLPIFGTVSTRITAFLTGGFDYSLIHRTDMINTAFAMFKERPILGFGLQNFSTRYGAYSHNNFTELLVSFGIVGTCIYYLMYILPITKLINKNNYSNREFPEQYLMLLFILIVDIIFGWGMIQFYGKRSMYIIGIALATFDYLKKNMMNRC